MGRGTPCYSLLAMRTTANRTTGYTPFFLEHGREARLPVDLIASGIDYEPQSLSVYAKQMHERISKAFATVSKKHDEYILRQRDLYKEKQLRIRVDDLVWLFTDRPNPDLNRKFQSFWSGPFRVIQQITNVIFKIQSYGRWSSTEITTTAAVDRLKKCYVRDPDTNQGIPVPLRAQDLQPYFEESELLGRLKTSEFAPHIFEHEQDLPFAGPPQEREFAEETAGNSPTSGRANDRVEPSVNSSTPAS